MRLALLFVLILSLSLASATAVIEHRIVGDKVLTSMQLDDGVKVIRIPSDARTIEANEEFVLENDGIWKDLETSATSISFTSESYIDSGSDASFFISRNPLEIPAEVVLFLPDGATLDEDAIVFPGDYELSTNGQNIIVTWDEVEEEMLVEYSLSSGSGIWWYALLLVAILVLAWFFFRKTQSRKNLTTNLFGDEKRIVKYLAGKKKKSSWTKSIVDDLGISKVTLSRKLRSLEGKGLIKKVPHGNSNWVSLAK